MPWLAEDGRCLAFHLIGMGASARPDIAYRFGDHARILEGFVDALGREGIIFLTHDWGVARAADFMARHMDRPSEIGGVVAEAAVVFQP